MVNPIQKLIETEDAIAYIKELGAIVPAEAYEILELCELACERKNEMFSIRDGEVVQLSEEPPTDCQWIAVQARSLEPPSGPMIEARSDGKPVEMCAIVACQMSAKHSAWQWLNLSPATKAVVGDLIFACKASVDRWYYLGLRQSQESTKE